MTQESAPSDSRRALAVFFRNPLVIIGIVILIGWLFVGLFVEQLAPANPLAQNVNVRLTPPGSAFLFGTDELGRDIFSRVLHGTRLTAPAGIAVVLFGSVVGLLVGAVAGFAGGLWDELFMRIAELFMAFPTIILALAITAALGPDIRNAILALVIVWWPSYARLVRGMVLEVKNREFVEGTRSIGAGPVYLLFRTVLPNCLAPAIILATLDIGSAILTFAGLSFLGLGPDPTSPEWGRMVSIGIDFYDQWWMWLFPGMAIASLVMAFNFIGDGLRDILDPRMRK
ncbi:MAG TPA: ABC transporter permease [Aggregatilineales bacterium]|nr:ABC transporter permease [Aggregatilineales bacterium]